MKKLIMIFSLLLLATAKANAGPDWELKKETPTLKIYTATIGNSDYKAVKVECTVKGRFSQIIAAFFDIDKQSEWVFNNKSSKLLKKVSSSELIYYSEISVPWPCANRDFIAHLKVTQISPTVVEIESHNEPAYIPENDGKVRIRSSVSHWTLTSIDNNLIKIDFNVQFDPGGSVPAWLINMFVTKGPFETFGKIQSRISMPAYQNASFDFIKD